LIPTTVRPVIIKPIIPDTPWISIPSLEPALRVVVGEGAEVLVLGVLPVDEPDPTNWLSEASETKET
jgi:hypothetical protein